MAHASKLQEVADGMSALGQKQTLMRVQRTSALPPKADIVRHGGNVRFVPKADIQAVVG